MKLPSIKELGEKFILAHVPQPARNMVKFLHGVAIEIQKHMPANEHSAEGFEYLEKAGICFVQAVAEGDDKGGEDKPEEDEEEEDKNPGFFKKHFLDEKED